MNCCWLGFTFSVTWRDIYHENCIWFHNHVMASKNIWMIQISHNVDFSMNALVVYVSQSIGRTVFYDLLHCECLTRFAIDNQMNHSLSTRSQLSANVISIENIIWESVRFLVWIVEVEYPINWLVKRNHIAGLQYASTIDSNQFAVEKCSVSR